MKKVLLSLAVVLFSSFVALPLRFTKEDETKAQLINRLKDSKNDLLKAVAGLTDAQLEFKPAPDRWSIIDVVEHLTIVEKSMMDAEKKLVAEAPNPEKKKDMKYTDAQLIAMVEDRSRKQMTPPTMMPKHNYASPADAVNAFVAQRDQLIDYVSNTKDMLRAHITNDPNFGYVDAYQLLLFNAAHTMRHIKQIDEVKADPGFPK